MKSETLLPDVLIVNSLTALISDAGNQFQVSTRYQSLDVTYVKSRINAEGIGFATKTLPKFGKHFDSALQTGYFSSFPAFKRPGKSVLPCFLSGLTQKIFALNGTLLDSPDVDAIRVIRQISYMFYKLEMDYPKELIDGVIRGFAQTDDELGQLDPFHHSHYCYAYSASQVVKQLFTGFDWRDIIPQPGPGVTADKRENFERWEPHVKYKGLHSVYPYSQYFYANAKSLLKQLHVYKKLTALNVGVSKLALVPKDSRGPRIICTEPHEFMWFEQGLGRAMMAHLENHPLTAGQVNFTDQSVNGALALSSSKTGKFATLDMKDASDRISRILVEAIFDEVPGLLKALLACTTDYVRLPDGTCIQKNKYASMGSALCFPVMSVVHFALAVAAIQHATGESTRAIAKSVFVYGDDLIVKTEHAPLLLEVFPLFGLKFNPTKCCTQGRFRESCGVDAYNGVDVTPQRVKTHAILRKDPASLKHFLAVFHGLFDRGLWRTAKVFQDAVLREMGDLPCVTKDSAAVGWIVPRHQVELANAANLKWWSTYQSLSLKVRLIKTRPHASMVGGDPRLLRSLSSTVEASGTLSRRCHTKLVWKRIPLSAL
jgi:hypothetical protein